MKKLSLCMIVRDEAQMLPAFLRASHGLYDELCVVDTGSSDATIDLLKEAGATVSHMPWQDDFAAARNKSLRMATGSHVLVLDADEMVDQEFIDEARALLDRDDVGAVCVNMVNPRPHGARSRTALLRMFRNDPSVRFEYPIHEDASRSVLTMLQQKHLTLATMKSSVLHLGYSHERAAARDKKVRDTSILWSCVDRDPSDLYSWFKLLEQGRFWADPTLTEQAAEGAKAAIAAFDGDTRPLSHFFGELIVMLVVATREHDPDEAAKLLYDWCNRLPDEPALMLYRGQWREELGALDLARHDFLHCLTLATESANVQLTGLRPRLGLARLALAELKTDEAIDWVEAALKTQPRDPEALLALGSLGRMLGGPEAAERLAAAYIDTYGEAPELWAAFGEAALLANAPDDAVRNLEVACAVSDHAEDYEALLERARMATTASPAL